MAKGKELELLIRISGSLDKSLTASLTGASNQVSGFARTLGNIGTAGLAAMGALATGTIAAISSCTKSASEFEQQMSDVVKYVDGLADATGKISGLTYEDNGKTYAENYAAMKDALLDLSTQIPMTAEDLTKLAAAAGQSGKAIGDLIQYDENGNITGFLRDVAMMGTAMDIDAEQAGEWAAKWEKAFAISHEEVMVLADQINYLGANSATTAAQIAEVVTRVGSIGQIAGVDVSTTAAIADAMLAAGVESHTTATSIRNIFTYMSKGASATKKQKEMWEAMGFSAEGIAKSMQEDSIGTLLSVFEAINNLPSDKRLAAISDLFGMRSTEGAAKIAQNMQPLLDALEMVSDPSLYTGSMEREFIIKASTPEALDTMMQNALEYFKIDMGEEFLPVKKEFAQVAIDLLNSVRENLPQLKELAHTLAELASKGVKWLAEQLPKALPYIQQALDYVNNNGPQVAKTLGTIAKILLGMKLAPGLEKGLSTIGRVLFGSSSSGGGLSSVLGWGGKMGVMQGLAVAGSALGSSATSTAGLALAGGAGLAGGVLGGIGLISAGTDLYHGIQAQRAGNAKDAKTGYMSAGAKAGMVGAGAGIGALIGSVVPVIGTGIGALVGAGIGGVGALLSGSKVGQWFSDATDEGGVLNVFFTQTLPQKWTEFWDTVGNFFTEGIPNWWNNLKTTVSDFFTVTIPEKWHEFWQSVGNFFTQTVPYALGYATGAVVRFFTEILPQKWTEFWDAVGNFFTTTLPTWASDVWNNHIVPFFTVTLPEKWTEFWDNLNTFFGTTVPTWASDIWNNNIVPFFTQDVPDFFRQLWDGVTNFVTQTIPEWISTIGSTISGWWQSILDWITGLWEGVKGWFTAGYDAGVSGAPAGEGIPGYARGGFTHGPSLAGEAGTEAVISFLPSVRSANIATWLQAGRMLGVEELLQLGGNNYYGLDELDPAEAPTGWRSGGGGGAYTYSPQITIQGNADRSVIDDALADAESRFRSWYEQMQRRQFRTAY